MAADDAMTEPMLSINQFMTDSYGLLCSNKLFMTVDDISVTGCSLYYVTYTHT